jgi:16S rRNA (guanine527-N7)-methyltransferase
MQAKIAAVADELGLAINDAQSLALSQYLGLLHKWSAAYNLSALKSIDDMLVKHVFDCLAVVKPILQCFEAYEQRTILDVGTGAGLPGIVLAVCMPNAQVTMLDAVQKKITFVRQAIGTLGLRNAQAHGARIQDWRGSHSIVTARAWTALGDIPTLTEHCIPAGGCIVAMKGPRLALEAEALPPHWHITQVIDITVPQLPDPRSLAFLHRKTV